MLEKCCNYLKQCRNNVVTLCCTENRCCKLSCVITLHVRKASIVATRGKQNERAACPKDVLEFNFFFFRALIIITILKNEKKLKLNRR